MAFQYYGGGQYGQPAPISYEQQQEEEDFGSMDGMSDAMRQLQGGDVAMVGGGPVAGMAGGPALAGPSGSYIGGGTMANASGQAVGSMAPGGSGYLIGSPGGAGSLMSSPALTGGAGAGGIGGGGGAGGAAAGGGAAAAGAAAALLAIVGAYEWSAYDQGRRGDDSGDYWKSKATGKWIEQDTEYYSDKLFGEDDKHGIGSVFKMGSNLATLDFTNAGKDFDDSFINPVNWFNGSLF